MSGAPKQSAGGVGVDAGSLLKPPQFRKYEAKIGVCLIIVRLHRQSP